jgi:hypothetical protein
MEIAHGNQGDRSVFIGGLDGFDPGNDDRLQLTMRRSGP